MRISTLSVRVILSTLMLTISTSKGDRLLPEPSPTDGKVCECSSEKKLTCGTDGIIYRNQCFQKCAGVQKARKSFCEKKAETQKCSCPVSFDPVCGHNGITYASECLLECDKGVQKAYDGQCKLNCPRCNSSQIDPVCGTDGETYVNSCFMKCEGSKLDFKGDCAAKDACECPVDYSPVCGKDNITYANICQLKCFKGKLKHNGQCITTSSVSTSMLPTVSTPDGSAINKEKPFPFLPKICDCAYPNKSVCGDDGITYFNECFLECANRKKAYDGKCHSRKKPKSESLLSHQESKFQSHLKKSKDLRCNCTSNYEPVCGRDGITYQNSCFRRCSKAKKAHLGECSHSHECDCFDEESGEVCGINGITYDSVCELDCDGVKKIHEGPCEKRCNCSNIKKEVCAKSGKTYRNKCELKCHGDEMAYSGPCQYEENSDDHSYPTSCACPHLLEPVCSKKKKTFPNLCTLVCHDEEYLHDGVCSDTEGSTTTTTQCGDCSPEKVSVCGADGKTYHNLCFAGCAGVVPVYPGECL